ncbi:hypothetical protein BHM03_00042751 [Ensete ventricosum]|nr:hypothetical protein BHM03_00042751 [Ensete ventricosum]
MNKYYELEPPKFDGPHRWRRTTTGGWHRAGSAALGDAGKRWSSREMRPQEARPAELVSRANAFICFWVGCFVHPGSWPSHTAEHRLYRFLFRSFHIFPSGNSRVPSPVYCGELHRS